ncbi:MAG: hypothetical protein WDO15_04165 [Bacteroidota bacterium]
MLTAPETQSLVVAGGRIDPDYLPSYGIKVLAGRNFDRKFNDDNSIVVNEALSKTLGIQPTKGCCGQNISVQSRHARSCRSDGRLSPDVAQEYGCSSRNRPGICITILFGEARV